MRVRIGYFEMLKAVYARLSGDLPELLPGLACPVFSLTVEDDQKMPYVVVSTIGSAPSTYKGHAGRTMSAVIDAYSDKLETAEEISRVMNAVMESLSRARLEITNDFSESFGLGKDAQNEFTAEPDVNGVVYHGTIRYEWTVEDLKAK